MSKRFYKGHYFIVFYDKTDEELLYMFDNVHDILKFKGLENNVQNRNNLNSLLYYALKSENHFTTVLNGKCMRVYIIDIKGD